MKLKACVETMRKKSESFALINKLTQNTKLLITEKYDLLIIHEDNSEEMFEGLLLASYSSKDNLLQFPYDEKNPSIPEIDLEKYNSLKLFGKKNNIIELTESILAFNPFAIGITDIMRRLQNPEINRNEKGEIESYYTLEEILAIAATFYNARAIVPITFEDYTIYISISE